jgi:hypothetical protein
LEAEALDIVHDTNKTAAAISKRSSEHYIAHLLFRHDRPAQFHFVKKFMWRKVGFFAEFRSKSPDCANRIGKNG